MESNPLRVLDSKKEEDIAATADAPTMLDFLGDQSLAHFDRVRGLLDMAGVQYVVDHKLVRGLDYYTRTAFEFQGLDLGAQDALGGGGRYDGLIEQIGGAAVPAVGFGFGMDRLIIAAEAAQAIPELRSDLDVFVVGLGEAARGWAMQTTRAFRQAGLAADCDLLGRSMKAQMREANRRNARHVVIAGDNELAAGMAQVKDMQGHDQQQVALPDLLRVVMEKQGGE